MAAYIGNRALDLALFVFDSEATHLYICSAEPTTYAEATSTYALGNKNFGGAGNGFGVPANASPNGRKVSSAAITDGSITASGAAVNWAVTDNTNARLLAVGNLAASQAVSSGNTFSLPSFDIRIPSQ